MSEDSFSDTATVDNDSTTMSDTATLNENENASEGILPSEGALEEESTYPDKSLADKFAPESEAANVAPAKQSDSSLMQLGFFLWLSAQNTPPPASLGCHDTPLVNKTTGAAFNGTVCPRPGAAQMPGVFLLLLVFGFI